MMAIDSKSKFLRDAGRFVLQGKTQQAISEYLKIVKNDPNDVLTLNTIGDLYLRLGKVTEANQYFMQVAEHYVRNNFLLKALAVYKKVLSSDPQNIEVNLTIATLNARQGLNVEARNFYLRAAELYVAQGNTSESVKAYEKIIELDPANTTIRKRLADIYLGGGDGLKALAHIKGAARAQAKAGNLDGALSSYENALQLEPGDGDTLRGLVDCSLKSGNALTALRYLETSLPHMPQDAELLETLGRVQIEAGKMESAAQTLQKALDMDESRYQQFFALSRAYVESGNADRAAECLDPILPLLIARRETGRAIEVYDCILKSDPCRLAALKRIADLHSAMNNQAACLNTMERIVDCLLGSEDPVPVLEYLEKILQINPAGEKYRDLHRKKFEEAFPGEPYRAPAEAVGERSAPEPEYTSGIHEGAADASAPKIVEADLLLNYGMRDRALQLLLEMQAEDCSNMEAHRRLLSIYREDKRSAEAAEQCLLLAALFRKGGDNNEASKFLSEAVSLDADLDQDHLDLAEFAREHGIEIIPAQERMSSSMADPRGNIEIDLSEDLSEIFFKGDNEETEPADHEPGTVADPETISEEYSAATPLPAAGESFQEQLQEVDFYLSLGFYEEARSKLDQIARHHADSPDVSLRYQQIGNSGVRSSRPGAGLVPDGADELEIIPSTDFEAAVSDQAVSGSQPRPAASVVPGQPAQQSTSGCEPGINEMFADLMDEVNAPAQQETTREEFESHFNLGIAYRESDLLDEAIQEFQCAVKPLNAAKSPREVIQCCGMLSTCYLDKKMARSAIRWCQTGLDVPGISSHETLALQYDMSIAYTLAGNSGDALKCLGRIFDLDPRYRDVAQKIDDLRGGSNRNVP